MKQPDELMRENEALRGLLSRLSEASLRINESQDLATVLQGVLDSARTLTGARYGVITTLDESGQLEDLLTSGMTAEERRALYAIPGGVRIFEYLSQAPGPLRLRDFPGHVDAAGFPDYRAPLEVNSFLGLPIRHRGDQVGNFHLGEKEGGQEFTPEDEETLGMFASQAALVIANARRLRDEQRARSDLETLINTVPVGVLVFDARSGTLASINREAQRIAGDLLATVGSVEEILETLTFRRADGREVSLEEFTLAEALQAGETVRAEEIVLQIPGGPSVTMLVNATPIRAVEGEVESVVVTLQDLSPLEELERLRAEFLGMVSHELRTPLTSIRGSATTLLDEESALDPAEMRQFFRIIVEQADHMRSLISDLLDVARIETGMLSVSPEPSDVASLVDQAKRTFLSVGGRNSLDIDLAPDLPQVMADRRRIVQVLGNLLSNAARYSSQSSAIRLTAVKEDVHVAISVVDEGQGISAEQLPHLFRKYTQLDGETRGPDLAGAGLGLSICRGIVEAHGGRIRAESEGPGLGTRFTFTIPAIEKAAIQPAWPSRRSRRAAEERTRVLAVDDDPQTLRYIRDALSRAGYDPVVTGDPEDVPRLMEEAKPHVALLDLMLPGTDGIDLMQSILENADVPVIFLSAYGQEENVTRALDMGAADYMVKPFAPSELSARIRAALRQQPRFRWLTPSSAYLLGDLSIDYGERRVTVAGQPVQLTATEYAVLFELSVNAGLVLSHDYLVRRVWGQGHSGGSGLVRTIVSRLRRKLDDDGANPAYIFTFPRVGYLMAKGETQREQEQ